MTAAALICALVLACASPSLDGPPSADEPKETRLELNRNRADAKGKVGGESHDHYSIRLEQGKQITITLRSRGDVAEFMLSTQGPFRDAEPLRSDRMKQSKRQWSGSVPETGTYHIYVMAHPAAKYHLKIESK